MKKICKMFLFSLLLLTCLCRPAFAAETDTPAAGDGNTAAGRIEIIYTADKRPPIKEIPKGNAVSAPMPITGDSILTEVFISMVTASASMLMLIIFIKKRRKII